VARCRDFQPIKTRRKNCPHSPLVTTTPAAGSQIMNSVVHFEFPALDKQRIAKFYGNVFGWKTEMLGPKMNDYVLAYTTEVDENSHPKRPGAINGGFYKKSADKPAQ
jgi:predicted enzyme related to lactoylglutathione lyase